MRPPSRRVVRAVLTVSLLLVAARVHAQVPHTMNYQVMLTDDLDEPLADTSVQLVFRMYDAESGGVQLWAETHNVTTNSIGVASVVLGSVSPPEPIFSEPLWLQLEVDGELMEPRRPLTSAPYAIRADVANEAAVAWNAENLDGIPAEAYTLDNDLWHPGILNDPSNPIDWTKLKNMPAGFADGVDHAGEGDGNSLDAADGDPVDVVYVDAEGYVGVGTTPFGTARLEVQAEGGSMGAGYFETDSSYSVYPAIFAFADATSGVTSNVLNPGSTFYVPSTPSAIAGISQAEGHGAYFLATGSGRGALCKSWDGSALYAEAQGAGYSGEFRDGNGVYISLDDTFPALLVENTRTGGWDGDAAYFSSSAVASDGTWTLNSDVYDGTAGRFKKYVDNTKYSVEVRGAGDTAEGLYVRGFITTTAPFAKAVETTRGREAVFGVTASEVEVMASGAGRLSAGRARVEFDRLFAESVAGEGDLRVTVSPIGAWSAVYVAGIDGAGFDIRSEAGDTNVEFHWVAVGRSGEHERRPEVTIPDDEADRLLAKRKRTELEAKRAERAAEDDTIIEMKWMSSTN